MGLFDSSHRSHGRSLVPALLPSHVLATLQSQPTTFRAQSDQTCLATNQGAILPDGGTGNPEIDDATRRAGSLGDRPLVVLTAGRYWKPDDPVLAKQTIADEAPDVVVDAVRSVVDQIRAEVKQ